MDLVSIIIPVYNASQFIARCLDSVIAQSHKNIEIICVNDGSTDNSEKILTQYAKFDDRIKIITKENGGLSSARNAGLLQVTGDYILFVDADDYISSTTVEILYKNATTHNSDIVVFDYICGNPDLSNTQHITIKNCKELINSIFSIKFLNADTYKLFPPSAWSKFYKTKFLNDKNIRFYNGLYYEDVPFWAEVYANANRMTYIPQPLYFYNTANQNSIMRDYGEKTFDVIKVYELAINAFKAAGHFENMKQTIYLLMMSDFVKKLQNIHPQFKERFFNSVKDLKIEIDYSIYQNNNYMDFEKTNVNTFQLWMNSTFSDFCNKIGAKNE